MYRVSLGLVSLTLSILLLAQALELVPDRDAAVIDRRIAVCEALAVECSLAASRNDHREMEAFAHALLKRNPDLVSVGVRDASGQLLVEAGGHASHWTVPPGAKPSPTHLAAPVFRGDRPWGQVEVCFRPLPYSGFWRFIGGPLFPVLAFTALVGFAATTFYLRRTFRHIDPAQTGIVPERVRAALNTLVEGVLVLDRDQRIVLANEEFARAIGIPADQLQGRPASDLPWTVGATEPTLDHYPWMRALREATPQTGTILRLRGSGGERTLSVNSTPILGEDGACRGALVTFDDLTPIHSRNARLRKLLRRLRRSQKKIRSQKEQLQRAKEAAEAATKAQGEFLTNVSHEIRTPMNAILGMTEVVLETRLSDEQRECLEIVSASAGSLLEVINDLLDLSKIEAGKFDLNPVDFGLRSTLEDTLHTLAIRAHKKGLELVCDLPSEVPDSLIGDPVRLRQVLVNLVGNAVKFTERGEVVVRVRVVSRSEWDVRLEFAVSDTGIGVPADKLHAIFQPFIQADGSTTRKYGGTGLGLSISSHLVELMGGDIWAESRVHQGSTFYFTAQFGLSSRADTALDLPALPPTEHLPVLVVDDNSTVREVLVGCLAKLALRPTAVGGVDKAMVELERAAAAGAPYPVVLLDATLPGGSSFALAERLQDQPELAGAVVVMIASTDLHRDIERCKQAGVRAYVRKPVRLTDLARSIRQALDPLRRSGIMAPPEPRVAPSTPASVPPAPVGPGLRILLADDNPFNQRVAALKLGKLGHSVRVVGNGTEALAALDQEPFDLLFTDVQMPDMDGFELTARIRAREAETGGHLPIIAMTAHVMAGDRERCLAEGMDGYVGKPISDRELTSEIARVVPTPTAPPAATWDEAGVLARVGGDRPMLRQLLDIYLSDAAGLIAALQAAVEEGDAGRLRNAAHSLKGMAGFVHAHAVVAHALHLEQIGERGELTEAAEVLAALIREEEAIERALRTFLAEQPVAT